MNDILDCFIALGQHVQDTISFSDVNNIGVGVSHLDYVFESAVHIFEKTTFGFHLVGNVFSGVNRF